MAEQGSDREPVGDRTDHRRLGERRQIAPGRMYRSHAGGQHVQERGQEQKPQGDGLHARQGRIPDRHAKGSEREYSKPACRTFAGATTARRPAVPKHKGSLGCPCAHRPKAALTPTPSSNNDETPYKSATYYNRRNKYHEICHILLSNQ